jgi:hypothetical protein
MDEHAGVLDTLLEWSDRDQAGADAEPRPATRPRPAQGPLIEAARVADEAAVQPAIDAWKKAHPEVAARLAPRDVMVDRMRGRSSLWYRVRINLARVPEGLRPAPARQPQAPKTRASS